MSNLPQQHDLVRVYGNGDGVHQGVKFFVNKRQADALGLLPGQVYDVHEIRGGLELTPMRIDVQAEGTPPIDHEDPFRIVFVEGRRAFHQFSGCSEVFRGGVVHPARLEVARLKGIPACKNCWIQAPAFSGGLR